MLTESIDDFNRPLISPLHALKLSMILPLSCAAVHVLAVMWAVYSFVPHIDHFGNMTTLTGEYGFILAASSLTLVFALFIGMALYGPTLTYLSLSKEARAKSQIIGRLKKIVSKFAMIAFLCNVVLALASLKAPWALVLSPIAIMIPFLILQAVVSAEIARYGIGPILGKLKGISQKI